MDKRKNNGGNSTKSKSGFDKRKNEYRNALPEASTFEEVVEALKILKHKAIQEKDLNALKLFLEYYLGKPDQKIDHTSGGEIINIPISTWVNENN